MNLVRDGGGGRGGGGGGGGEALFALRRREEEELYLQLETRERVQTNEKEIGRSAASTLLKVEVPLLHCPMSLHPTAATLLRAGGGG
jgi:hypothetical protein